MITIWQNLVSISKMKIRVSKDDKCLHKNIPYNSTIRKDTGLNSKILFCPDCRKILPWVTEEK